MELGTFTRCSSSHDTSALSTRKLLTLHPPQCVLRSSGKSASGHVDRPSTTHTRARPATSDEGQSRRACTSQWTDTEVQGCRKTYIRRPGILRHVRLGSLSYLGASCYQGNVRR